MNLKSVVAIADGEMFENIIIKLAKKYNISSFSLLPVYISPQPLLSDWFHAEKIFVHGKDGSDALTDLGYDAERIIITGNPKYDYLKSLDSKKPKKILESAYQINSKKKLIVIGMARWHDNDEQWMANLIKFCNLKGYEIVIKIHPLYKTGGHEMSETKIKKIKNVCQGLKFLIAYDIDLSTLLAASDLVITEYSNIGVETILLEKPLLTVNFLKESFEFYLNFHEYSASIYIEDYSKLEKVILEIFEKNSHLEKLNEGRKGLIERLNFQNDGKASSRIINYLTKNT